MTIKKNDQDRKALIWLVFIKSGKTFLLTGAAFFLLLASDVYLGTSISSAAGQYHLGVPVLTIILFFGILTFVSGIMHWLKNPKKNRTPSNMIQIIIKFIYRAIKTVFLFFIYLLGAMSEASTRGRKIYTVTTEEDDNEIAEQISDASSEAKYADYGSLPNVDRWQKL